MRIVGPRIGSGRGRRADLESVNVETAIGERREQDASTAAHIEHAGAACQTAGEHPHVPRTDDPHERFDQRDEFRPGHSVIAGGIKRIDHLAAGLGLEPTESAIRAVDDFEG